MALVELVGGALLGVAVGELLKAVIDAKQKASSFQPSLTRLESTLRSIIPRLGRISRLNHQLNHPEMEELVALLNNGKALVLKCSKISSLNLVKKVRYSKQLLDLNNDLLRYFATVVPLDHFKDTKEILLVVNKLLQLKLLGNNQSESAAAAWTPDNGSILDMVECRQEEANFDENQCGNSNTCLQSAAGSERNTNGGGGVIKINRPPVIVRHVDPHDKESSGSDSDDSSMIVHYDSTSLDESAAGTSKNRKFRHIINWQKGALLGSGSFGTVYEGYTESLGPDDKESLDSDDSSMIVHYDSTSLDESAAGTSKNGKFGPIINSWQKGALLGSGSFGTVYEGYTNNGLFFAVMEVSLDDQGSHGQPDIYQIEKEISFLSQFEHENIVQYLGTYKDEAKFYIFSDLVTKGSLAKLYQKYTLQDSLVSAYTRQILNGLKYLHERYVVHRNINCANILIDACGSMRIAGFGLAKAIDINDLQSHEGNVLWMAPEVVVQLYQKKIGCELAADIWSLGCTVLEMLTRQIPYSHLEGMQAIFKIGNGEPPPVPDSLSREARDFIFKCLQVNPDNRPTAAQLLEHPFVKRPQQANSSPASPHYFAEQHQSGSNFMIKDI